MSQIDVAATINGRTVTRSIEPRLTLAEFLRDQIGLTGTKVSCELQVCGVCTVLVDGKPVSSCAYLAADVDNRTVLTVEGLSGKDLLHPIQQAFVDNFALQCGYCTPGFLMMAMALLEETPSPTADEITDYLEGNICRCTGYVPIVKAVMDAARRMEEQHR